jgi:hypothetical protein
MQGWQLNFQGQDDSLLKLVDRTFPSLTHLRLDHCVSCPELFSHAARYLKHLTSLDVHSGKEGLRLWSGTELLEEVVYMPPQVGGQGWDRPTHWVWFRVSIQWGQG